MIQFRKFSKFDWMTYSGAEPFTPEQEPGEDRDPYIADFKVDGIESEAVVDSSGVILLLSDENDETYEMRVPFERAALALVKMKPEMTKAELEAAGFKS